MIVIESNQAKKREKGTKKEKIFFLYRFCVVISVISKGGMSEPPFPQVLMGTNVYKGRGKKRRGLDHIHISKTITSDERSSAALALRFVPIAVKSRHSRLPPLYSAE